MLKRVPLLFPSQSVKPHSASLIHAEPLRPARPMLGQRLIGELGEGLLATSKDLLPTLISLDLSEDDRGDGILSLLYLLGTLPKFFRTLTPGLGRAWPLSRSTARPQAQCLLVPDSRDRDQPAVREANQLAMHCARSVPIAGMIVPKMGMIKRQHGLLT